MPKFLRQADPEFEAEFERFLATKREASQDVDDAVRDIIEQVRRDGDAALIELSKKFDRADLVATGISVTADEIEAALAQCEQKTLDALKLAHDRIAAHHARQMPKDDRYTDALGVELGSRWTAVEAVGLYVPGGTAAYPSSVLMNAVPAKVAGVERIAMTVPASGGAINPLVLAAAHLAGVTEIHRVGGAQAIAALAYGTETIRPVAKIVGPGNAYVAAAKRRVFGTVGIDMIAGPSEVLVVADGRNDPDWIAADLLAQAEHDAAAQSILITDDEDFGEAVAAAVERQLKRLSRAETAAASWRDFGAIIIVGDFADAVPLIDRIAAEHLELAVDDPEALLAKSPQRRRRLPRPSHARSDRRLCRRLQPRAADGALGAVFVRALGARLRQAHVDPEARARPARRAGAGRDRARRGRGARRPRPFRRHPAESSGPMRWPAPPAKSRA